MDQHIRVCKQQILSLACEYAQAGQSCRCSYTRSMDVGEYLDRNLDI